MLNKNFMNEPDAKDRLMEDPKYRGLLAKQVILIEIGNGCQMANILSMMLKSSCKILITFH